MKPQQHQREKCQQPEPYPPRLAEIKVQRLREGLVRALKRQALRPLPALQVCGARVMYVRTRKYDLCAPLTLGKASSSESGRIRYTDPSVQGGRCSMTKVLCLLEDVPLV